MKNAIRTLCCFLFLAIAPMAGSQIHDPHALSADPALASEPIAPELKGLGDHHFKVTTNSPRSQYFFDQGLRLTYAFNHSEALRAFKEAARLDPENAMAYWGWALVLGPNLNLPMMPDVVPQAFAAIQRAVALKGKVSEQERGYIEALAVRYVNNVEADRAALDGAYADAMANLHEQYPEDVDAATFYAASLMNLSPWNYWGRDGKPHANTEKFLPVLESVMASSPNHPGANHYYIHAVEATHPKKGEASADRLRGAMPGAGHMVHMPSHIYMRVGRYADSFTVNTEAIKADEGYLTQCRAQGIYPLNYYPHNMHFLVWSAMLQGRSEAALSAARKIETKVPRDEEGNVWALYETFLSQPLYTLVRFGRWQDVLKEPEPSDNTLYMKGVWHYARAMAYAHKGKAGRAKSELKALAKIRNSKAFDEYAVGLGSARTMLQIADEVARAELAARNKNYDEALLRLAKAVRLEDHLTYNEPPDWYFPIRHILGAVLIEAGYPQEAEVVYWTDLRRHPDNGYALFGLMQSLKVQGKGVEAEKIEERFNQAWQHADVQLTSSRY